MADLNFQDFFVFTQPLLSVPSIYLMSFFPRKKTLRLDPPVIGVEITRKVTPDFSFRPMYRGGQYMSLHLVLDQLGGSHLRKDPAVEHAGLRAIEVRNSKLT